jgi:hypothetical protein
MLGQVEGPRLGLRPWVEVSVEALNRAWRGAFPQPREHLELNKV